MTDIRAFIAIELTQEIQFQLGAVQQQMDKMGIYCVRWVSTKNIHLTLQFLGDTAPAKLELLSQELHPVIASQEPFNFQVQGIGAFPNSRRPRVIWVGLQAPSALITLHKLIAKTVRQAGIPVEDRDFSPHLTLGRVNRNASADEVLDLSATLEKYKVGTLGTVHVKSVCLFRSDLRPEGPVYSRLALFPLNG